MLFLDIINKIRKQVEIQKIWQMEWQMEYNHGYRLD